MSYPLKMPDARICIIRYPDETTICANIAGFRALGEWMAWLAASDPSEYFHFHVLWHLESEAPKFDGIRPKNIWVLTQAEQPAVTAAAALGAVVREFELTFQVCSDLDLDELSTHQDSGTVPERFQKKEAALLIKCD